MSSTSRSVVRLVPGGPVLCVAAAVMAIAVATDLSVARVHLSLPVAVTLPAPAQNVSAGGAPAASEATTVPTSLAPTTTAVPASPRQGLPAITPTAVPAQYPVDHPNGDNSSDSGDAADRSSGGSGAGGSSTSTTSGSYGGDSGTATTTHTDG